MDMSVRASVNSIAASGGSLANILEETRNAKSDDRKWSWTFLKEEFQQQNLESLFIKYRSRINDSTFAILLLMNIFVYIVIIGKTILTEVPYSFKTLYFPTACFILNFSLLTVMCNEKLLNHHMMVPIICRVLIYIILLLEEYTSTILDCKIPNNHSSLCCPFRLGYGLYLILVLYLLIPMPRKVYSFIGGIIVIGLELLTSLWLLDLPISMIFVDIAILSIANAYGIAWLFLEEITQRRVFLDLRSHIQFKLELQSHKEEEEQLMLSVLPQYIVAEVKQVICEAVKNPNIQRRPFNELFVKRHKNVSILFADIVRFTQLTVKLKAFELVKTLNDLFGKFDQAAQENNCMRIKILGDCYYCISGIPIEVDNHANNCIATGLEMLNIISEIREKRRVPELNMRIGVNSGNVNSGILGITKWQYDVWSEDVIFANYLEQTGKPGHIHISKATKEKLKDAYELETNPEQDTFFIVPPKSEKRGQQFHSHDTQFNRRVSTAVTSRFPFHRRISEVPVLKSRNSVTDTSFKNLNKNVCSETINQQLNKAIESMAVGKREQWLKQSDINALFLTFKTDNLEVPFLNDKDPLFRYYLLNSFILTSLLFVIGYWHFYPTSKHIIFPLLTGIYLVVGMLVIIIAWYKYIYEKCKGNPTQHQSIANPGMFFFWKTFYFLSEAIKQNLILRASFCLCGFFIMILWMVALSVVVVNSYKNPMFSTNASLLVVKIPNSNYTCNLWVDDHINILGSMSDISPRHITYSFVLIMMSVSFYLKTHYLFKLSMHVLSLFIFIMLAHFKWEKLPLFWESRFIHVHEENWWQHNRVDHIMFLVQVLILFHVSDRQVEYLSRIGYLWNHKLKKEQKKLEETAMVNKVLLCNILPLHVAEHYLSSNSAKNKLYHNEHDNIAVMFASIPNFMESYSEKEITDEGVKCLQVLNQVIGEFDELLFETQFKRIEKIKIIGSTYMAAAGLTSCKEEVEPLDAETNVVMMTKFAIALMEQLVIFNENSMQEFTMRIGIDVGPVIAGVVGANKPLYDIWGNTVNIASRLDTSGVHGRMQVTKNTADILKRNNFTCEYRGITTLKGVAKPVETYFVCTEFDNSTYL